MALTMELFTTHGGGGEGGQMGQIVCVRARARSVSE